MAISAFHRPFKDLVMEWLIELVLNFAVATEAQLRLAHLQQFKCRETRLLGVSSAYKSSGIGFVFLSRLAVG